MKTGIFSIAALVGASTIAAAAPHAALAQGYDAPPPGSYWQTCQNVRVSGGGASRTLSAECRDVRGGWRSSSLRYTDCRGEIENRDGQLACFSGDPNQGGYRPPVNGGGYGNGYGNGYGPGNGGGNGGYGQGGYGQGGYGQGGYGQGGYGQGGYGNGGYGAGGYPGRPGASGGSITIFYGVNFTGPSFGANREITNLPKRDNDKAMSLRISRGSAWQVCTDSDFRGRCEIFTSDVRDLNQFGMGEAVTSMRQVR
ncbi:beta/gamma crystallin-related protein [Phenylobacterium aquaticum]|uniref:beta/gamma crystallin-related protein n=1 Tax=Phenylobacterium aquaticum TaxID=1763816 RepID=UPI0026EBB380|nr:beta/gamma crystallin-related protein [Phenylobacterium aquaticum]